MRIIDLSVTIDPEILVDPPVMPISIDYIDHIRSIPDMLAMFPGADESCLPGGYAWAVEDISLNTHSGTHLDAPYHYHPTMNGGERAWTIDEVPLEWCIGDGVVIDFSDKPDGYVCTPEDFEDALARIGYTLKPGDIVLVHTNASGAWGSREYLLHGCGVGREATLWLCDQGIRVVGTDAWSWDAPLSSIAEKYRETGDASLIWQGHKAGRERAYCHMEKLCNLEELPPFGFTFIGLPIKIKAASAGWIRAAAIIND